MGGTVDLSRFSNPPTCLPVARLHSINTEIVLPGGGGAITLLLMLAKFKFILSALALGPIKTHNDLARLLVCSFGQPTTCGCRH